MKRVMLFFLILLVMAAPAVKGQNANLDRLNAYKIAFFTKRLNLTSQEAEKFWPVYNDYQARRNKIQQERVLLNRNFNQNVSSMSEKELSEAGNKYVALQVREAALAQEFHNKVKEILSPIKVIRLYQAENQYRMLLLNELREKRPLRNEK